MKNPLKRDNFYYWDWDVYKVSDHVEEELKKLPKNPNDPRLVETKKIIKDLIAWVWELDRESEGK